MQLAPKTRGTLPAIVPGNEIGFVGLGAMGSRMAVRFLTAGHAVYGTNRTASKAAPLIERGLVWRDTPREVTEAAEVIFSVVMDDAARRHGDRDNQRGTRRRSLKARAHLRPERIPASQNC